MVDVAVTGCGMPPDIQYFLDGSLECFNIPPDVYLWGMYFCPNITAVIDGMDSVTELQDENHGQRLNNYGARLEQIYLEWQKTADANAVALCLAYGITYSGQPKQILREVAGTLVEDELGVLAGLGAYKELIRHQKDGIVYFDGPKLFERHRSFFESRYRIRRQWETLDKPDFTTINLIYPFTPSPQRGKASPPPEKTKKKALKRSANLLNSITGEPTVQLFLSGEEVSVTGRRYRFSLTKQKWASIGGSHGTADTRVYHNETGEFVCGLCVYTPNVTVFDHLASIVLHCKSGLEDLIIDEANITSRGNTSLLPESKIKQIDAENQITRNEAVEAIEYTDMQKSVSRSIFGPRWLEMEPRKQRISALNEIAVDKLYKRVLKKYPHLFEAPTDRIPRVAELFFGPER